MKNLSKAKVEVINTFISQIREEVREELREKIEGKRNEKLPIGFVKSRFIKIKTLKENDMRLAYEDGSSQALDDIIKLLDEEGKYERNK